VSKNWDLVVRWITAVIYQPFPWRKDPRPPLKLRVRVRWET